MSFYHPDADPYPYHHHHNNNNNNNQFNDNHYDYYYQYNPIQYQCNNYYYAQPQNVVPQSYYYSDGFNCYEVRDGYCFPVVYNYNYSVSAGSELKSVELEGVSMDLIEEGGEVDDDYDPTPYSGGYDIVEAYGKPLPASDAICYPRSGSGSEVRAIVAADDFESHNSGIESENESESDSCFGSEVSDVDEEGVGLRGNGFHDKQIIDDSLGEENEGVYGEGEQEKVVVSDDNVLDGYELSSESPGFCDGLYGYLPCLNKKKNVTVVYGTEDSVDKPDEDPWKAAADFIFGSLNPYAN